MLAREPRPTALLAFSDQLALGVVEAAGELGLSVPGDLSVVGFDDVPEAATAGLTSVHQDHAEKGRLAGEMLVARLRGEEALERTLLPARLVVRGSTGPPPKQSGLRTVFFREPGYRAPEAIVQVDLCLPAEHATGL